MSVLVMSQVWLDERLEGASLLIALALADHAHDDGTHVYPSVERLMKKTRTSRRTVQRALREFEASGLLRVVERGGEGPKDTTIYAFDLRVLSEGRRGDALADKGVIGDELRASSATPKGVTTPPEPSENHQGEPPGTSGEVIDMALLQPTRLAHLLSDSAREHMAVPDQSRQYLPSKDSITAIERLHRLDGIDYAEIEACIQWLHHSSGRNVAFWRTNILSGGKLREQFFRLRAAAAEDRQQETGGLTAFLGGVE